MADLPTREELRQLPLRSIVAFAARCARRVQPLFRSDNPEHVEAVDRAIRVASEFAAGRAPEAGGDYAAFAAAARAAARAAAFAAAAAAARAAARAAAFAADDAAARAAAFAADDAAAAADADAAAFAAAAADAAAAAADAAASAAAADASAAALAAALAAARADAAARTDFDTLRGIGRERGQQFPELADPIDVSEEGPLGPLWPDGPPEDWPPDRTRTKPDAVEPPEPCGDTELLVEIEVPADVTEEELIRAVGELADRADGLHRALGGNGLKIERLELEVGTEVPVPGGAPRG